MEQVKSSNETNSEFTLAATGESFITLRLAVYNEKPFIDIIQILRNADIAFTNLETLIHNYEGYPIAKGEPGTYPRAPPIVADDLKWAGIQMVSQVNNHSLDYGYEGMFITSKHLDRVGIAHAGTGKDLEEARAPVYIETNKARIALIATTPLHYHSLWQRAGSPRAGIKGRPGANPLRFRTRYVVKPDTKKHLTALAEELGVQLRVTKTGIDLLGLHFSEGEKPGIYRTCYEPDLEGNLRSVRDARRQADLVFMSIHSHQDAGTPDVPAQFVREFCRACIDAGANAILGHGPHMLRGIEIYKGNPIFYSLGNLFFQNQQPEKLPQGEYNGVGMGLEATPADFYDMREYGSKVHGQPINKWYRNDMRFWQGVIALTKFSIEPTAPPVEGQPPRPGAKLTEITIHPVTLQYMLPRSRRGRPILAEGKEAEDIIDRLRKLSEPFGTKIECKNGIGRVTLE